MDPDKETSEVRRKQSAHVPTSTMRVLPHVFKFFTIEKFRSLNGLLSQISCYCTKNIPWATKKGAGKGKKCFTN
jgi:hypothetical protein